MSAGELPAGSRLVEAEFSITSSHVPFVRLTEGEDCRVQLVELLPRTAPGVAEYFAVRGADPRDVLASTDRRGIVDVRVHLNDADGGLVELVVGEGCPLAYLAECGAIPVEVRSENGVGTIVVRILPGDDATVLVSQFLDQHPAELVAKRRDEGLPSELGPAEGGAEVLETLTDRQREVLFAAFEGGYFERPRRRTGEEIATDLDITGPTFQQHLRAAEGKVFAALLED